MNRQRSAWLALLALCFSGTQTKAVVYNFTNIADTTTAAPNGMFESFGEPAISGDTVAFVGSHAGGGGIFTGNGGSLTTIVKSGDLGPAGPFGIVSNPSISGGQVAFHGGFGDALQTSGIFVGSGGPLTTIAIERDAAPVGTFAAFGKPSMSGGNVAFLASFRDPPSGFSRGIFVGSGGMLTTIVKSGDAAPSGSVDLSFLDPVINGDTVVFVGFDSGFPSVYTGSGGPISEVVRTGDTAPVGNFLYVYRPTISGGAVAFHGDDEAGSGIFMHKSGIVTTIVRALDLAPSGTFDGFWESAIGGDTVAFLGEYSELDKQGIFLGNGGPLTTVIKTGDPLFGSTIEAFSIGGIPDFAFDPDGSGSVAFLYSLSDGRVGVALARPVPEPSTLGLAGLVAALTQLNVRFRRVL